MVCGQFLCSDCISSLKIKLRYLKGNIHSSFIPFQDAILTYEKGKIQSNSEHYIGHCCIIKHYRKKYLISEKLNNAQELTKKRKKSDNNISFGGAFCLPEYSLMIANDLNCMDVFGIGKDYHQDPLLHYVLDETNASQLYDSGYHPNLTLPTDWIIIKKEVSITLPHVLDGKKKMVSRH